MKRVFISVLITLCFQGCAQETPGLDKPRVDTEVELLSIVFRLAGKPEYSSSRFELYADRIERHFENYENHELIDFTRSIMYENGIGYDAVMSMAIHLDDSLKPVPGVKEKWPSRWGKENTKKFIPLLNKFYKDAKCDIFFEANADLYAETAKRFLPVYKQLDLNWYYDFYGKEPTETFSVIIGLGNWGHSYGPSLNYIDGSRKVYAILGIWRTDGAGMPVFSVDEYLPVLLHEFIHSFVNYLTGNHREAFRESGERIFAAVKDEMIRQAYPNREIMLNEALVRASVIKYMKDHDFRKGEIRNEIIRQKASGFFWMEELVAELENYDNQRGIYPTLESYMPKLIEAYDVWAEKYGTLPTKDPRLLP